MIAAARGSVLSSSTRARLGKVRHGGLDAGACRMLVSRTSRRNPSRANDPRATVMQMETDREALYGEVADITVDCTAPIAAVVGTIVRCVNEVDAQ